MFTEVKNPKTSQELEKLVKSLYGNEITIEMFVDSTLEDKNSKISLIKSGEKFTGYLIWLKEREVEEEDEEEASGKKTVTNIFAIDEIVLLPEEQTEERAKELAQDLDEEIKKNDCSIAELTIPSQSFWLIPVLVNEGLFNVAILRVSKELEKRTEFVQIFNKIQEGIKPDIIKLMISKEGDYKLEIIEEPTDYKKILESGYSPEIVSMIFNVEKNKEEELLENVNQIAEWQEYAFSLVKYY
ncbi:MAG: hypothetical protein KAU62_06610 [Candidatus Heimdallarchaeota archaeon]|nr:hypothetical protein [Candidatus Heimdallarchaeota archaeon]MCK4610811.1 hypothetical protein [Candidatus Heimdallarchaeota archaeon]